MKKAILVSGGTLFGIGGGALAAVYLTAATDPFEPCRSNDMIDFAQLGASFELTTEDNELTSDEKLVTKPTLLYFGYTFCPDVCPLDNARNADALYLLDEKNIDAQALFVSVDPQRDTPEVLKEFTEYFHDELIGLTGPQSELRALADAYSSFYEFQDKDEDEFYLIDHSTQT